MDEGSMVTDALSRVLHVLRVFGMAPLRFSRRHSVTIARVCTGQLWYGYLLAAVLNIMLVAATMITITDRIRQKDGATMIGRIIMLITIFNSVALITNAAYGAHGRMKHLLLLLRQLHKITIFFPKESTITKDKKRTREATIILVFVLVVGIVSWGISLYSCFCCNAKTRDVTVTLLFTSNTVHIVIVSMLAEQLILVMQLMRRAVSSYNVELKRLLSVISKGDHTESNLLQLEESIWRVSRYYLAFCENVRTMTGHEGKLMLQVIIFFIVQLMNNAFRFVVNVRKLGTPNHAGTPIEIVHVTLIMHLYSTILFAVVLWALSNACDKIHEKVQKMRALVSEVMYLGRKAGDTFSTATGVLCEQMLNHQPNFKPLSVCAVNRSLFITVISGVITYLVTVIKFYTMEASTTMNRNE